ncbi:chloride channel protein EriC [Cupriavidus sp. USMAA2-4]|uniref:chloride channel protein n=1 Tax=unclassified Cupriavidus TaxID=2640874 RepID=UPI0008A690FD|nr:MULTISPECIES: chloride channel protein [unclassified Cupriavidus]AOY92579.1 chloride channel protein EriC [Cupriavidus sp. USMAA2-4]AOZ00976.1 chloride channel protein EriC [Cupriavidus sp. USMAHM13]
MNDQETNPASRPGAAPPGTGSAEPAGSAAAPPSSSPASGPAAAPGATAARRAAGPDHADPDDAPAVDDPDLLRALGRRARSAATRKSRQVGRLSRTTMRYTVFMCGAGCVALFSMVFAWLAEWALQWNERITTARPWLAFLLLPCGLAALRWLTIRFAPQARGSGIPQVIAAVNLPEAGTAQNILVSFRQSMWKVVLTAGGLMAGASIGREGPSVQVGAAAMLAWGRWCHERLQFRIGFHPNALIAAGAAGGLAAAFNTPLAGVVFAIEELGKGTAVRWDRLVLTGVLTAGFLSLAIFGNNPYFTVRTPILALHSAWGPVLLCAVLNGVLGGLFAKALIGGVPALLPARWRGWPGRHPVQVAFGCGLVAAAIGWATGGATFGTGYGQAAGLINGVPHETTLWFGVAKLVSTVVSYFAGIPGGIFTPSLAIGAGIGANVAHFITGMAEPRVLALVSMAAFLAAATQAPITASVIVMEMTRSQDLTLFLLAASLLASFLARQFCPHPFYHHVGHAFRREAVGLERKAAPA